MRKQTDSAAAPILEAVAHAARGNQDAFRTVAQQFEPMIYKLLATFDPPESERDDWFQEGLIGLYKAVLMYNPGLSSFGTFAYLCIKRSMISAVEAYNKKTNRLSQFPENPDEEFGEADGSLRFDPQVLLLHREAYTSLLERIDSHLSDYENTVLRLFLTGVSHDRIAQKLDTSRKSVDNAISRIRRKLKVLIEPTYNCY